MTEAQDGGDIAVIGLGCRYPGDAKSTDEFFEMLIDGRSGWSEVPEDRFNVNAFWHPSYDRHGSIVSRGGYFLKDDVALFDAPFFSMTQAEADAMDPQHRILLEVAYESLEDAGISISSIAGSDMSCFAGGFSTEYHTLSTMDLGDVLLHATTGNGLSMMSNRLKRDLPSAPLLYGHLLILALGPSMTVDTACSSSLVALDLACRNIRSSTSKTRQALVAGVNLILFPDQMTAMNPLHFLSPDSQCYSFDQRANGYARGEGAGVLVLKHIDDAIRDNDCIRAVIRATGVNQDGKTPGITLPSSEAQASLIRSTYKSAGLDPNDTTYLEAHGTGTVAGDVLEMSAISSVFSRSDRRSSAPFYVGSIKPNIGHQEAGAGLAGLIKAILTLEAGIIPPNINFQVPNPKLRLQEFHIAVPIQPTPWPGLGVRRASVNSFGYGGTNGHCILDDAYSYLKARGLCGRTRRPKLNSQLDIDSFSTSPGGDPLSVESALASDDISGNRSTPDPHLFVLSTPDQAALPRLAERLSAFLERRKSSITFDETKFLRDMAFTLRSRRSEFQWRKALVAENCEDLASQLRNSAKPVRAGKNAGLLFCFTGQGAQWQGMGRELLVHDNFRQSVVAADEYVKKLGARWSVLERLCVSDDAMIINKPELAQPLCAILQIALVDLLRYWNILPTVVVGHSSGEIGAAYAFGALSAEDCWKLAYFRGKWTSELKLVAPHVNGSMMAVGLSEAALDPYFRAMHLSEKSVMSVACFNSPSNVTISGDREALEKLELALKADGVFCRMLAMEVAGHSSHMRYIAEGYRRAISDIKITTSSPGISMMSTFTGKPISAEDLDPSYWVDNMIAPVRFSDAIETALYVPLGDRRRRKKSTVDTIIEIGPHSALQGPIKEILQKMEKSGDVAYLSALRRGQSAIDTALRLAGTLWTRGSNISLEHVNNGQTFCKSQVPLVGLPKYPWNHANRYWHESSLSKSHRFRHAPRTDLLGAPVLDFSMLEPTWKNILRISELPWLNDHKVQGNIVFPAAGMICAVLESGRQVVDKRKTVKCFEIKDVRLDRALIMPPSDPGIVVFVRLHPRRRGLEQERNPWYEFTFVSLESSQNEERNYIEHASGLIRVNYQPNRNDRTDNFENAIETRALKERYLAVCKNCNNGVTKGDHYETTARMGLVYGPTFQGLIKAQTCTGEACFTIAITDTKEKMPAEFEYEHLLHPSTLDCALQTATLPIERKASATGVTIVPTRIEYIRVSAAMPVEAGKELVGFTATRQTGLRDSSADITLSDSILKEAMLEIHNMTLTKLGDDDVALGNDNALVALNKMCSKVSWKPDIDLLDPIGSELGKVCSCDVSIIPQNITERGMRDTRAATVITCRALGSRLPQRDEKRPLHLKLGVDSLRNKNGGVKAAELEHENDTKQPELKMSNGDDNESPATYADIYQAKTSLFPSISQDLSAPLNGTTQALPAMINDSMLTSVHDTELKSGIRMFQGWFDLKGHKQPDVKILEVGCCTSSVTVPILETLGGVRGRTPRFRSYCVSNISTEDLEKAKELLIEWQRCLEFRKLDIEDDLVSQDFELESFDVIVADNVLRAAKSIDVALGNCYRLLKQGGKLLIGDVTDTIKDVNLVSEALPRWWLTKDDRKEKALLTEDSWITRLHSAGFTGPDYAVATKDSYGIPNISMMVSTKPAMRNESIRLRKLMIVMEQPSGVVEMLADAIQGCYLDSHVQIECTTLKEAAAMAAQEQLAKAELGIVSLIEYEESTFARCNQGAFEAIRTLIMKSSRLFWVTGSATADGVRDPLSCAISGLLRAAKSEEPRLRLHELHLRRRSLSELADAARMISRVVEDAYTSTNEEVYEDEILEIEGVLSIPRLIDDEALNETIQTLDRVPLPDLQYFNQCDRPMKLTIGRPGLLKSLHFVNDDSTYSELLDDHIEVEVRANAVNTRSVVTRRPPSYEPERLKVISDVDVALGHVSRLGLGIDAAGVVRNVGSKVRRLKIGDRVAFPKFGAISNVVRVHGDLPQLLPENMSFEGGASIPFVFMTAYRSLVEVAQLSNGEFVLIHFSAGDLGQAMIQMAQYLGAVVLVTVSSKEKRSLVTDLGVQGDHIFSTTDLRLSESIKRMTGSKGVDVIINTLTGEAMQETWECLATFGRFVDLRKQDDFVHIELETRRFAANISFAVVNIEHMCLTAPTKAGKLLQDVFNLVRSGELKAVKPIKVFDYSNIEQAFRTVQEDQNVGKVVLRLTEESMVPALLHNTNQLKLNSNATYVLAGGLGGIGRALALYLADHGAGHLAFLSRTGRLSTQAQEVLDQLRRRNLHAAVYACDITDQEKLKETFSKIQTEMPHIKGVIQAATVLRDGLFESMSYENWVEATRPKIDGSWNLHETMPKDLDFFVMLSSISGIMGNRGQSNYCAGNTYQDALAHHRQSLGLTAHTIDLGAVSGMGWLKENKESLAQATTMVAGLAISKEQCFQLIKSAMTGYSRGSQRMPTQIVAGIGTGGLNKANLAAGGTKEYSWLNDFARFSYLRRLDDAVSTDQILSEASTLDLKSSISAATTMQQATDLIASALCTKLAKSMIIAVDEIDAGRPVSSYGVDSLVAAELRTWFFRELEAEVSIFELLGGMPIIELARVAAERSKSTQLAIEKH